MTNESNLNDVQKKAMTGIARIMYAERQALPSWTSEAFFHACMSKGDATSASDTSTASDIAAKSDANGTATSQTSPADCGDKKNATLIGVTSTEPLEIENASGKHVAHPKILVIKGAVCGAGGSTNRVQLIGDPADKVPLGANVEITGDLSTDNETQYYATWAAINVKTFKRID